MAQPTPLMPHATATWLVDNTALSFDQIAAFCGLHILEVQAMADDLAGSKYTGRDPLHSGELTLAEIERGQQDPEYRLKMQKAPVETSVPAVSGRPQRAQCSSRKRTDSSAPPASEGEPPLPTLTPSMTVST